MNTEYTESIIGTHISLNFTCASSVVQVDVGHLHTRGEGGWVHSKVMVLGTDLNAPYRV